MVTAQRPKFKTFWRCCRNCKRCAMISICVSLLLYLTVFGQTFLFLHETTVSDGEYYATSRIDHWREHISRDTYIFSLHVMDNLGTIRFVICDLLVKRRPKGVCCFFDANNTIIESSSFAYYRIPEFRTNNRQVE